MSRLVGFRGKSFVDQIQILIDIGAGNEQEYLKEITDLFLTPTGDRPVDEMIQHTLRELLEQNEAETIKGLTSPNERIKRLCLQATAIKNFVNASSALLHMAYSEQDSRVLYEILRTMSMLQQPEFVHVFRRTAQHPDSLINCLSIKMLGRYKDEESLPELMDIIETEDKTSAFEYCSALQAQSVIAISETGTDEALRFLVKKMHHKNPTARRIIHEEILKHGASMTSLIAPIFQTGNVDEKIMAANILGRICDKSGGEVMADALVQNRASHPNIQFAIYEAFGNIHFPRGQACLLEALEHSGDMLLFSAVTALNKRLNDLAREKIKTLVLPETEQSQRILHALAATEALNIFAFLYGVNNDNLPLRLINSVADTHDPYVISVFVEKLGALKEPAPREHIELLRNAAIHKAGAYILAVDDSRAMLAFYRSALASPHVRVTTAENGEDALERFNQPDPFDLIITAMNMPVMDGLELARRIREKDDYAQAPIIMVTMESELLQQKLAPASVVTSFLVKPMTFDGLLARVSEYIQV